MRQFILFFSLLLMISCKTETKKETQEQTKRTEIKKPSWLIGNWVRTNNKPEHITYETWKDDFSGYGLTLKNNKDTTFYEKMKLVTLNDTLVLEVSGVNEKPTPFKFTQQTDTSFVCVNKKNEFPKNIHYWLDGEQLKAKIWNDDSFAVDFVFEKRQ